MTFRDLALNRPSCASFASKRPINLLAGLRFLVCQALHKDKSEARDSADHKWRPVMRKETAVDRAQGDRKRNPSTQIKPGNFPPLQALTPDQDRRKRHRGSRLEILIEGRT